MLELVSPSDNPTTVRAKIQEYLQSGLRLGWLINPADQQAEVYRPESGPRGFISPRYPVWRSGFTGFYPRRKLVMAKGALTELSD